MRIAVLGANGRTGRHLVSQALAAGHEVRVLVRGPERELDALRTSQLDWTAVRPSQLTNGPKTGRYRVSTSTPPGARVARADVADFILKELQEHRHGRQAPFIAR